MTLTLDLELAPPLPGAVCAGRPALFATLGVSMSVNPAHRHIVGAHPAVGDGAGLCRDY
jgi:hypothetical protein